MLYEWLQNCPTRLDVVYALLQQCGWTARQTDNMHQSTVLGINGSAQIRIEITRPRVGQTVVHLTYEELPIWGYNIFFDFYTTRGNWFATRWAGERAHALRYQGMDHGTLDKPAFNWLWAMSERAFNLARQDLDEFLAD